MVGTLDTKGAELRYFRDRVVAAGVDATLVDVSTSGDESQADVTPTEVAAHHPAGRGGGVHRRPRVVGRGDVGGAARGSC